MRPNLVIFACLVAAPAIGQQINIPAEITDEAALPRVMPRFAKAVIAFQQAQQPDPAALFKAQLVAGLYGDALQSLDKLRALLADNPSPRIRVMGLTRGKGCSPGEIVPYEHDGADAAVLVDWIAAQPWSDGQVGMFGGSYSGFAPWAAAKQHPKALKSIMVGAPVAPGIDVPMEGNVFWNFVYPWPFYTTTNQTLNNETITIARAGPSWITTGMPAVGRIGISPKLTARRIRSSTVGSAIRTTMPIGRA